MIAVKILLYLVYGGLIFAGLCIPLYFILIPLQLITGIKVAKRGEYVPDMSVDVPSEPEKQIQWIVREETERERRK